MRERGLHGRKGTSQKPVECPYQSSWKPKRTVTCGQSPHRSKGKVREGRSGTEKIPVHWAYTLFSPMTLRKAKGERVKNEMWTSASEMGGRKSLFLTTQMYFNWQQIKLLFHKLSPQQSLVSEQAAGWVFILQPRLTHDNGWVENRKINIKGQMHCTVFPHT